jgi:hypothetical protein
VSSFETVTDSFALSGHLSEWLFASDFWQEAGLATGISFDQYEEEEVSIESVEIIIGILGRRIVDLRAAVQTGMDFRYAEALNGKVLMARIKGDDAASELTGLVSFMRKAQGRSQVITCSL